MATLALAAAGAAAGGALLPGGLTLLGATLSGATIGSQIGALAGSYIDNALFAGSGRTKPIEGPRLQHLHVTASTEGAPIPRIYGRVRLGGQIIWADEITEEIVKSSSGGGSGKGASAASPSATTIEHRYAASFAVALCEGVIAGLGRVWADGREIDLSRLSHRLHLGSETQPADPLIVTRLGADAAPAFRGTAYLVFENLPLAEFGNRIPQLSFEVYRPVEPARNDIKGVVLIPGSGEFVYATEPVTQTTGGGATRADNVHTLQGPTDWSVALDQLEETLPSVAAVSLVVSWFGTDLRAGLCQLKPGVERTAKVTEDLEWQVAGVERASAYVVSERDGRPAYGGTPSDATVVQAIQDLAARGKDVIVTPFILMDVPAGNTLPDPYGNAAQGAYPWRGRITVHPAAGEPGTPDKTAAANAQVAAFVGTAAPADFAISGTSVSYSGPAEWSLRRQVLHYAHLAKAAGGVAGFIIGSELRGLSTVRSAASTYPFVAALVALAADVKAVLGPGTKVTYAADWSEYFGHQPADGTGDVHFHLDPLWSSAAIDAIGIDLYWPLSDWRDGGVHLDRDAGWRSIYDVDYLRANITGGEGFDWYYASAADRDNQVRTPVTDGAGKPWVFRFKDLESWWSNAHTNRPAGVEAPTPTSWVARSKPVWLTEVGCPAVDKGANQPNVFVDPKSSENALPYFSRGNRDDLIQRRYLEALIQHFDPAHPRHTPGANPVSPVYGAPMVDPARILAYCWDARPYPAFPFDTSIWSDGENWHLGHWLTGRFAGGSVTATLAQILTDFGFTDFEIDHLPGVVPGYVIDRVMSARDAIEPLELAYFFDTLESGGNIAFRARGQGGLVATFSDDDLVETKPGAPLAETVRAQETDLPRSVKVSFIDAQRDFESAVAEARRLAGASGRVSEAELPIVLDANAAAELSEAWLYETWAARERVSFELPPTALALEPGDIVALVRPSGSKALRITGIGEHGSREITASTLDAEVYLPPPMPPRPVNPGTPVFAGRPDILFLDLPLLSGDEPDLRGHVVARQAPWPGSVAVYSSPETSDFTLRTIARAPATKGTTLDPLPKGPLGVVDRSTKFRVSVEGAALQSRTAAQVLGGANLAAVRTPEGEWEVLQFETANLVSAGTYELSGLIRGQAGTEHAMRVPLGSGAPFVVIDDALTGIDLLASEIGAPLNWRYGPGNRDLGDATYRTAEHTFQGVGARPLSPVHVRGRRTGGDLTLSWIRRTRRHGDAWSVADVPLGEESERYEVDILDGAVVKRTLAASTSSAIYTSSQQMSDFGAPQSSIAVAVYQLSVTRGRGIAALATV
ncbi:MAG: glycoside hydrolase/phage tail family protein [Hyphomicrobium sp.]|nr:glycoside hydrolase/phage tail family protein [Hyphomicrobium sp.]